MGYYSYIISHWDIKINSKCKKSVYIILIIEAQGLRLMFQYEKCTMGSQSGMHDKFYFETDEVTVTLP